MPALVLSRCPDTGEPVPTGVVTNLIGLSRLISRSARFNCKECGATHVFLAGAAWLSLTEPRAAPERGEPGERWFVLALSRMIRVGAASAQVT